MRAPRLLALLALASILAMTGCSRRQAAAHRQHAPAPAAAPAASASLATSYEARQGKLVFQHYCALCHGDAGAGDGFNAYNLDPHPRDLGDPAFQKARSDADLGDAIRRGGAGVGLSALMPPWGHTLSDRQIVELVAYLRSLRRPAG